MTQPLKFDPVTLPASADALREEVRGFLREQAARGTFTPEGGTINRHSAQFSRACGEAGYIGMTWPRRYGGHERSFFDRYIVTEEMLAVGAPVWAHWVADRQSGPVLLRHGTEALRADILPRITRGECHFCIGMSEPDSGSDLFSLRSRAEACDDGWRLNGRKVWTSNAHRSHYMIALLRTSPARDDDRRFGLSQFIVPMDTPGITITPIINMTGGHDFNEVLLEDVAIPRDHLLGEADMGARQASGELAYERSGPERFLETIAVLYALLRIAGDEPGERLCEGLGRLVAQLMTLRSMSLSVAGMLEAGQVPDVEAALVKELGTNWQQALPGVVRDLAPAAPQRAIGTSSRDAGNALAFETLLQHTTLIAPKLTIQGGTREILRGIIARGLGLR